MTQPEGNKSLRVKHGLTVMKRAVKKLAERTIDGRTTVGKALGQWRGDLIADLGGRENISTQQAAIVDLAVKSKLLLDSIDAWLLTQPSLIDKRRRALLPVVRERQQIADALARHLGQLGLERRVRRVPSLGEYVAQRYGANDGSQDAVAQHGPVSDGSKDSQP